MDGWTDGSSSRLAEQRQSLDKESEGWPLLRGGMREPTCSRKRNGREREIFLLSVQD